MMQNKKKRFLWLNHGSFFRRQTKSNVGRKTEAGKSNRRKNLRILQHKKDEKRIAFEDYEGLFLNKKLKLSSNLNYLFTRSFFRKLTPKKLLNILG